MKPIDKLHATALSLATAAAFSFFTFAAKFISEHPAFVVISGTAISLVCYRGLLSIFIFFAKRWEWVKKLLHGPAYVNGTWAGYYIGAGGQIRYFVERYEQQVDGLLIKGESKNELLQPHCTWLSLAHMIDSENGFIVYLYQTRPVQQQTNGEGIAFFNFERRSHDKCPWKLSGYTIDTHIGHRIVSRQIKVSNHTNTDISVAFDKAQELSMQP
jgi:hypothetical protein